MLITFVGLAVIKIPISVSLMFSALAGSIAFGEFFPLRHLVEGGFWLQIPILVDWALAMIFAESIKASGLLNTIAGNMTIALHKKPTFLLVLLTFFIMIAGMITGSSTAISSYLPVHCSSGAEESRIEQAKSWFNNRNERNLWYDCTSDKLARNDHRSGRRHALYRIHHPLLLMTFPCAIVTSLIIGARQVKPVDLEESEN